MLTTVIAGRVWDFSHAVGRNAAAGNGFSQPTGLALAPNGIAYVVSRGNENNFGSRVTKVFIGEPGEEETQAEFARYGTADDRATWPSSVALDSQGNVYLSDDWLNRISVFDADGNYIKHWGTSGAGEGELNGPAGLAFDQDDNLYVVDSRNHRIQKFTKDGAFITSYGSYGSGPGQFDSPWGITVDAAGAIYVADWKNNRVQKLSSDGTFQMQFGSEAELNRPSDVAVDPDGDVYVCDWGNHRIRIYDSAGEALASLVGDAQQLAKWAQQAVDANPDMVKMRRRANLEPEWRFLYPTGVAFDAEQSRLIVTDNQRGRLQIYIKDPNYMEPQANL
jgi:DNA-binding beta-propeller fold protein YncE